MKILVLGGDGFCGWPTALYLSKAGHDITIVDNLSRRQIDVLLEVDSLTPIAPMSERLNAWHKRTNLNIDFVNLDIAQEYDKLCQLLTRLKPAAIVHFAEQRSAPYSMKSDVTKRYTIDNNVNATNNLLCALVETKTDAHVVHLGSMGVYGYGWSGSAPIPEGYVDVKLATPAGEITRQILHPANPGSIYHLSKTLDQLMFAFYAKNDQIRVTDLHQGIVWGTQTDETLLDPKLINRFDYDGDYGTVLNRFLVEAAVKHPLTVHGSGGQTRAFIHIRDTVRCIELALSNPPASGEKPRIFNQMTETYTVLELANLVAKLSGATVKHVTNPRKEDDQNELVVENSQFMELGLQPTTLSQGLIEEVEAIAKQYKSRINLARIPARSLWIK